MMKKIILAVSLLVFSSCAFSQATPEEAKAEKHCSELFDIYERAHAAKELKKSSQEAYRDVANVSDLSERDKRNMINYVFSREKNTGPQMSSSEFVTKCVNNRLRRWKF